MVCLYLLDTMLTDLWKKVYSNAYNKDVWNFHLEHFLWSNEYLLNVFFVLLKSFYAHYLLCYVWYHFLDSHNFKNIHAHTTCLCNYAWCQTYNTVWDNELIAEQTVSNANLFSLVIQWQRPHTKTDQQDFLTTWGIFPAILVSMSNRNSRAPVYKDY